MRKTNALRGIGEPEFRRVFLEIVLSADRNTRDPGTRTARYPPEKVSSTHPVPSANKNDEPYNFLKNP